MKCLYIIEPVALLLNADHAEQLRGLIVAKGRPAGPCHTLTLPASRVRITEDTCDARGFLMRAGTTWEMAVVNTWFRPIDPMHERDAVRELINELAPHPQVEFTR